MSKKSEYKQKYPSYYAIWQMMIQRCNNPKNSRYKYYGALGISVSSEWRHSFEKFMNDMGERPNKDYSIDRIDVKGNYCKENCRWATKHQQCANKRNSCENIGVRLDGSLWTAQLRVKGKLVLFKRFKSKDDAILARKKYEIEYSISI